MAITYLQVEQFRNIQNITVTPAPQFNFIFGPNGSGKTSLLEAIFCLGRGRSFRTHKANHLIAAGTAQFRVIGKILHTGREVTIGIQRDYHRTEIHIGGKIVTKAGDLAQHLPIAVLEPGLHEVIEGPPENRRRFMDWGVFHVEPGFRSAWERFRRALSQRNAALKAGWSQKAIKQWDIELAGPAQELDAYRRHYIDSIISSVQAIARDFPGMEPITFTYDPGWDAASEYLSCLRSQFPSDRERGYTQSGPHRADLQICAQHRPAREVLSRGQQKLCVASLILAQCQSLSRNGNQAVILVDDLAAELDGANRRVLLTALANTGSQVFITGTDASLYAPIALQATTFHVKHGAIERISGN
jgi:DNA replication and repair protein RecF